ncbi:MAG: hypothetical protein PHP75_07830, partial [Methylacidiphilaceae bacterium]|nr:hypothetical protein [Candidatus Methylacidiphilaceae bacterium]
MMTTANCVIVQIIEPRAATADARLSRRQKKRQKDQIVYPRAGTANTDSSFVGDVIHVLQVARMSISELARV